ncbi:hypothetical protein H0E87_000541 [Populus deltoides]|uniref:F-box domain-containing protein n=1 Tax=Populus deltoides TaxID=3696 RepID=A0A8T2ZN62_POPDE|nr:hypothetical protein H0E87_000541 [Populus deltoides]
MSLRRSFLSRRFSRSFNNQNRNERNGVESGRLVGESGGESDGWGSMLPELLGEIIKRVEESEDRWPQRQNVVACACVCKKWREVTKDIVKSLPNNNNNNGSSGKITFPSCLKQPGPRDLPHQCLIKRNKKTSTFYLYLALTPCK